ncbi:MAG: tetratricopeptide repeat protein [Alphaproteobacteria bacterium]|nr:tetratricopeptide repeat protein [Alphaproteobacteria bacterium]
MLDIARQGRRWIVGATVLLVAACTTGDRSATSGGTTYESLMRIADGARQGTDPMAAVPIYRQAHDMNPKAPEPMIGIGQTMLFSGNAPEAAAAFQDALKVSPGNVDARRGLGAALIAMSQPELALAQYEAAAQAEPGDPRAQNGAGVALDLLGRPADAQGRYEAALRADPRYLPARNNYGLSLISAGRYPEAIEILAPAAGSSGATVQTRGNLALAYGLQGDDKQALRWLRADMDEPSAHRYLAYFGQLRAASPEVRAASIRANPQYYPKRGG